MRILLTIHHHLERDSGAPGTTLALADAYERAGHETRVLSFDDFPRSMPPQIEAMSFPLMVAGLMGTRLARLFDVIDASTGDAWLWSLLPRRVMPLLVTRSHGLEHAAYLARVAAERAGYLRLRRRYSLYHGGLRLWEVGVSLRRADLAFLLNRADRDYAVEQLHVSPERAHVVRNGLDAELLGLPAPEPGLGRRVALAVIGRHSHEKGADVMVAALGVVLETHPGVRVTLLGTGKSTDEVLADFEPGVRERVHVLHSFRRVDLPRLLAGHEVVVSATLTEGFGKALLEAMACGLAPVAAAAPGPTEFVDDERNGLLVPPGDSRSLGAAVVRLLRDPELRVRLRRNAHATAQRFSWDATAAERLELIAGALKAR